MAINKTYIDKGKHFGGWYYDDQQNVNTGSRLLTVSLHANSVPVRMSENAATDADGIEEKNMVSAFKWFHDNSLRLMKEDALMHYPFGRLDRDDSAEFNKYLAKKLQAESKEHENVIPPTMGYFLEPLCTCFTTEDFNITIGNVYQQSGGDTVEQIWNSFKPFAPHIRKIIRMGDKATDAIRNRLEDDKIGSWTRTLLQGIVNGAQTVEDFLGGADSLKQKALNLEDYLNKNLVMNGARFSYYGGTSLTFNSLAMKFTIFPKWIRKEVRNEKGEVVGFGEPVFKSVLEQVIDIYPYVAGQYSDSTLLRNFFGDKKELSDKDGNFLFDGLFGWNTPPGDFHAISTDVDVVQKGTLKLVIGHLYSLTNLVIENASFNFSHAMVKNPAAGYTYDGELSKFGFQTESKLFENRSEGALTPLYCDVNLLLKPITKYTSNMLEKFVSGTYNDHERRVVQNEFNYNLSTGKESMEKKFVTSQHDKNMSDEEVYKKLKQKEEEEAERRRQELLNELEEEEKDRKTLEREQTAELLRNFVIPPVEVSDEEINDGGFEDSLERDKLNKAVEDLTNSKNN